MILLVTDTSGKQGSVALVRAGELADPSKVETIGVAPLTGGTFSAQLVPQIASLLAKHGLNKSDIGAFIVVSGPGSFTGLRVGLAAMKGLAEILHSPIVSVSILEVLARHGQLIAAGGNEVGDASIFHYAVAIDAGRGEAFVGQYEIVFPSKPDSSFKCISESLLDWGSLAELIESGAVRWVATPDKVISDFLRASQPANRKDSILQQSERPTVTEIASVGWHKLNAGQTVSAEHLEANYIRRTDAELLAKLPSCS